MVAPSTMIYLVCPWQCYRCCCSAAAAASCLSATATVATPAAAAAAVLLLLPAITQYIKQHILGVDPR